MRLLFKYIIIIIIYTFFARLHTQHDRRRIFIARQN